MSEDMLGHISLSELRGLRDQVEDRLTGKNSERYREELKLWLRGGRIVKRLIRPLRTVLVPAQPEVTTSKKYFEDAWVTWMSEEAESVLLGLEVGACEETTLTVNEIFGVLSNFPILAELGNKTEISVSQLCYFLDSHHKNPRFGFFVFYLRDRGGRLWAVNARWDIGRNHAHVGWHLGVDPVDSSVRWDSGYQVVSHNKPGL